MPTEVGKPFRMHEGLSEEQAETYLEKSFKSILSQAESLGCKSLCMPSIGAGCRGYSPEVSARMGMSAWLQTQPELDVEIRCIDKRVIDAWRLECERADLEYLELQ